MAIANMLLTLSVYILIPVMPLWMIQSLGFSSFDAGLSMGIFGLGIFILGPFCSYFVRRYRRNIVCIIAILLMASCIGGLYMISLETKMSLKGVTVLRLFTGAAFGLAQMVLSSTLIIDTCESFQRTEANHSASWFGRFALSLGPFIALIIYPVLGFKSVITVSVISAILSIMMIRMVKFPFKAPDEDETLFSIDRFFLPQGIWLFINLTIVTTVMGLIMSLPLTFVFYGMMMMGFFIALLAQKFVFVNAELKSEIITGLILLAFALLMLLTRKLLIVKYVSPLLIGLGIGIIGARFLLFFIKLSRHCQRGTSQSTFFLSWELGLSLGLYLGYTFFYGNIHPLLIISLILIALALVMYNFFTHPWFLKHKNR